MKTRILILSILTMVVFNMHAQEEDPNHYLKKAMSQLEEGKCNSAQMYYNVYIDLSGKKLPSLEKMIAECITGNDTTKTYRVGDVIRVGSDWYTVANVTNDGKHGFAVCEMGSGPLKNEYITGRKIPSWSEFQIIASKNTVLKLSGKYWSSEPKVGGCSSGQAYMVYGLGTESGTYDCSSTNRALLFVYRF